MHQALCEGAKDSTMNKQIKNKQIKTGKYVHPWIYIEGS